MNREEILARAQNEGKQQDLPDLARPGRKDSAFKFRQKIRYPLAEAGPFGQVVLVLLPEAGQKCRPQADFLKDFPAGRFFLRFVPLHVPLGEAVRPRHFPHDHEKGPALLPGKHHGAAGTFQIFHHHPPPF